MHGTSRSNCAADSLTAAKKNLDELGVDYVDLLLVHFPPVGGCGFINCGLIQEQWKALTTLVGSGARAIGVSNFCISCFKCLEKDAGALVPAANQIQYHIGMGADPGGLLSYSRSKGIQTQAYSPLGSFTKGTSELINGKLVTELGGHHNKSGVQVALRWIWEHGVAVTTKSGSAAHLKQDLDLFDWA